MTTATMSVQPDQQQASAESTGMKFLVAVRTLKAALTTATKCVTNRSSLPILYHVLLQSEEVEDTPGVRITGSDINTTISAWVPADIQSPGAATCNGKMLADALTTLPDEDADIEQVGGNLILKCGRSTINMLGLPPEKFPPLPGIDDGSSVVMPEKTLKRALTRTLFAMSKDTTKPTCCGVHIESVEGGIEVVATDTHQLPLETIHIEAVSPIKANVPAEVARDILALLSDSEDPVTISCSERHVKFVLPNHITIIAAMIEGAYIQYHKYILTENDTRVVIPRDALLRAIRRALLAAKDDSDRVTFNTKDDGLLTVMEVTAVSYVKGSTFDSIPIQRDGPDFSVIMNGNFIANPLAALDCPEVYLDAIMPKSGGVVLKPIVVRPAVPDDYPAELKDDYLCVIMPMSDKVR